MRAHSAELVRDVCLSVHIRKQVHELESALSTQERKVRTGEQEFKSFVEEVLLQHEKEKEEKNKMHS